LRVALCAEINLRLVVKAVVSAAKNLNMLPPMYNDVEPMDVYEDDPWSFGAFLSKMYEALCAAGLEEQSKSKSGRKNRKRELPQVSFEIRSSTDGDNHKKKVYLCLCNEKRTWSGNHEFSSLVVPPIDPKEVNLLKAVADKLGVKLLSEPTVVAFVCYT